MISIELPTTIKFIGDKAFFTTSSIIIKFNGIYDIKYEGNNVFQQANKVQVVFNYQNKTYCGFEINESLSLYISKVTTFYRILNEEE